VLNPTSPSPALIPPAEPTPPWCMLYTLFMQRAPHSGFADPATSRGRDGLTLKNTEAAPKTLATASRRMEAPTLETPNMGQSNFIYKYFAAWTLSCLSLMWFLRRAKEYLKLDMIGLFSFAGPSRCAKAVEEATSAKSRSTQSQVCKTPRVF